MFKFYMQVCFSHWKISPTVMALSSILIGEIGEGDEAALLCVTDLVQCYRSTPGEGGAMGEWFYLKGSLIFLLIIMNNNIMYGYLHSTKN